MKEVTLEENSFYVSCIAKPSLQLTSETKECTLERNLVWVSNVGKPSLCPVIFKYIHEFTLEKIPKYVSIIAKTLLNLVPFTHIKEPTLERNLVCQQFRKPFTLSIYLSRQEVVHTV
jgi:hypothetical protein